MMGRHETTLEKIPSLHISYLCILSDLCSDDRDGSLDNLLTCSGLEECVRDLIRTIQAYEICDDLVAFFYSDHCLGFSLQTIGCIDIFDFFLSASMDDIGSDLGSELALLIDPCEGGESSTIEMLETRTELDDRADLFFIQSTCAFLTIARDKWYGRSLVGQYEYCLDLIGCELECLTDLGDICGCVEENESLGCRYECHDDVKIVRGSYGVGRKKQKKLQL